ncbi:GntR family transcriptional regulator [Bremerella alba]|uniref:HTH-type transcriptional regulator LutR n=1 Tax=Bremerella alba TaxID=980252 RepID=A0A7V9A7G5_9BACT|nr:GntR family transcriptional regulator [Bremerella alba]MBA2115342.1 HTH-type transcriptional regulator LutR [Bremerella alba]
MKSATDLQPLSLASVSDITKPLQRGGLRTQVSQRLAIGIFARHFKAGEKLTVQPLAEQFGVSRTPVREALMELESLGMVEVLPHKGALVREFGPQEARDLIQFRKILEREAIRCACGKIPREQLELMHDELIQVISEAPTATSSESTRELDIRLHTMIAAYCQNRRLQEEIARCWTICKAMADAYYILLRASDRFVRIEENQEHLVIVEALLSEDSDASQKAIESHLDTFLEDFIQNHFPEEEAG